MENSQLITGLYMVFSEKNSLKFLETLLLIIFPISWIFSLIYHEVGSSTISHSMGGCGAALSGDPASIYYNPAGISDIKNPAFSFTLTYWISKLYDSPNYEIIGKNWISKRETTDWEGYFFPIYGAYVHPLNFGTMAFSIMAVGGWRETGQDYIRQRFATKYSLTLGININDIVLLGISPNFVQMIDFKDNFSSDDEWHIANGYNLDFGFIWNILTSFRIGLEWLPPFKMYWDAPEMVFGTGSIDGVEGEPSVLRGGVAIKVYSVLITADVCKIMWTFYDPNAIDILQYHFGVEFPIFNLPFRIGIYNEPPPWNINQERIFLTTGTSLKWQSFTFDIAVEGVVPVRNYLDLLYTTYLTLSYIL